MATEHFRPASPIRPGRPLTQVVAGDFNGDGFVDLATANMQANSASVLLGDGAGKFAAPIDLTVAGAPTTLVALSDLNSDGRLDLVLTSLPGTTAVDPSINILLQAAWPPFRRPA